MFQYRFKKWNKKIWIAKKVGILEDDDGYEVSIYSKPKVYEMNVQPINSSADIQEFGEKASEMQKAVIELNKYWGKFKEFDVAYLDGVNPSKNDGKIIIDINELADIDNQYIKELEAVSTETNKFYAYTCPKANYRLYPPRNQNKVIQIYFKRLTNK